MSAIGAVFRFDGAPVPAPRVASLLDAMAEYGPELGSWAPDAAASPVGLGCRPFRVTAEDAGYRPPLISPDGQVVLVADARIDNRGELGAALGFDAGTAAGLPDAGFILAAYQAWGRSAFRRLIGDFAIILWDQRQRALLAARDGPGQRVLFYHPRRWATAQPGEGG
jgi:asparagine synthase (glutamine-hydrolysing)